MCKSNTTSAGQPLQALLGLGAIYDALGCKASLLQGSGKDHGLVAIIFNDKS
jgi:hypothetical protein